MASGKPKLLSLKIYKHREDASVEVCDFENLAGFQFFQRSTVREHLKFHARTVINHTQVGKRQSVKFEGDMGYCHTWVHPAGLGCTAITDASYPIRVAYQLISDVLNSFIEQYPNREYDRQNQDICMPHPAGQDLFDKFQNPEEADKITKIEKELDEVKGTVMNSMDEILKRGETLDSLMSKSNDLSKTSYEFYKTAKKNNQCCSYY